jgi:DNA-directed RNA polymerase specialized sigma24 family protein
MTSDSEFKPRLYDHPIPLTDLTFEELLKLIEPRIRFHSQSNKTRIPGFDQDDISQELMIKTYTVLQNHKLPKDMVAFDYRFLRYFDFIFRNTILSLWRSKTRTCKGIRHSAFRDALDDCLELFDEHFV